MSTSPVSARSLAAALKNLDPSSPYRAPAPDAKAQFRLDCMSIAEALSQESADFDRAGFLAECGVDEIDHRLFASAPQGLQVSLQRRAHRWFLSLRRGPGLEPGCLIELRAQEGERAEVFFGLESLTPVGA